MKKLILLSFTGMIISCQSDDDSQYSSSKDFKNQETYIDSSNFRSKKNHLNQSKVTNDTIRDKDVIHWK